MSTQREMTLQEWVDKLPGIHSAHKEFNSLQVTIAQQAERIAELDEANEHHRKLYRIAKSAELNAMRIDAKQAALIEQCETALSQCRDFMDTPVQDRKIQPYTQTHDALTAIAKHKKGIQCT